MADLHFCIYDGAGLRRRIDGLSSEQATLMRATILVYRGGSVDGLADARGSVSGFNRDDLSG